MGKKLLLIGLSIFLLSVVPIASVDAAKHYTVNLVESLTLDDTNPVTGTDDPQHYTVNLVESLTLEAEISKHVEISLDETIILTDSLSNSSESSFSDSIFWLIDSLSTLILNNQ